MNKTKFNLSFAGCGFLGIYHVGVAACLKKYAPHLVVSRASGASAGAIAAACLLCDAPLGQITKDVLRIATLARSKTLGPFSPSFNIQKILRDGLEKILPEDAHLKVNGKLNISLTRAHDRQNVIASQFNSRDELIQALLCSAFIPLFSGFIPPVFRNHRYLDGGFTDNVPIPEHDPNENISIVTISPFAGENDICPRDNGYSIYALLCSSFVPIFSGWMPPKFQNTRYMDGCYSDNLPIIDNNTITVSPFCGESDICPRDSNHSLLQINLANTSIELSRQNLYRFSRTLFPPNPEILSKMCQQGFDDTLRFLARNDLIGCTDCTLDLMDLKSNPSNDSENLGEELKEITSSKNYDKIMSEESCHQCKVQREAALLDSLPETVVCILQDAIDSGNRGLFNWLFSHQSVRIISLMSLPCLLPAEIVYATGIKLYEKAPKFTYNIRVLSASVIQLVANTLAKMSLNRSMYTAQLSCQLAITEYDEDVEPQSKVQKYIPSRISAVIRNKMNFGFTLNIDKRETQSQQLQHYTTIRTPERRRSLLEIEPVEGDEVLKMTEHQEALMACYYLHNYSGTIEAYNSEGNHLCQQNSVLCEVN